jgi:hypothetical protein
MSLPSIQLLEIGAAALPATTPPLTRASTWAPLTYVPPPLATPASLTAQPIAEGVVMTWVPTFNTDTVVEVAANLLGTPGAWSVYAQTRDSYCTLALSSGQSRFVRVKAVRYGRSSLYSGEVLAQPQLANGGPGRNLIGNPSFEDNVVLTGAPQVRTGLICNLWTVLTGSAATSYAQRTTSNVTTGQWALRISLTGQSLANGGLLFSDALQYVAPIAVIAGQRVRVRAKLTVAGSGALLGCVVASYALLTFYNAAGAVIASTQIQAQQTAQSFTGTITADGVVPTGTARAVLNLQGYVFNGTGSTQALAGELLRMDFDDVELMTLTNLDNDAIDGTVHGRIAIQDTSSVGGVNRLGIAVPGSGQRVGDSRNLPTNLSSAAPSYWDGLSVTYTAAAGGTATVNVSAATRRRGSASVSYSASLLSLSGLATGTTLIYLYYLDAASAGGARTLNYTTNGVNLANDDAVCAVGPLYITVPASGSGSGGGSVGNGGGIGDIPPGGLQP